MWAWLKYTASCAARGLRDLHELIEELALEEALTELKDKKKYEQAYR